MNSTDKDARSLESKEFTNILPTFMISDPKKKYIIYPTKIK